MKPYAAISDLRDVVLEESYILDVVARPGTLELRGDFVLGLQHPRYHRPPSSETDCFIRGVLSFRNVRRLVWEGQGVPPATDATGEIDYGHIDDMQWDGDDFRLEGDWGRIQVVAASVSLVLSP
jgi:hypothetical protein